MLYLRLSIVLSYIILLETGLHKERSETKKKKVGLSPAVEVAKLCDLEKCFNLLDPISFSLKWARRERTRACISSAS